MIEVEDEDGFTTIEELNVQIDNPRDRIIAVSEFVRVISERADAPVSDGIMVLIVAAFALAIKAAKPGTDVEDTMKAVVSESYSIAVEWFGEDDNRKTH